MVKKIKKILSKNIEVLFVFFLSLLLSYKELIANCLVYLSYNFDIQALFLWNYSAYRNLIPYKDIFYPYGILQYFHSEVLIFKILFFLIIPFLFTSIFIILKILFQKRIYAYLAFFSLFIFVKVFNGDDAFRGYGIAVVFSLIVSTDFYLKRKWSSLFLVSTGIAIGVLYSLIHSQGFYTFVLVGFLLIILPVADHSFTVLEKRSFYIEGIKRTLLYGCGFIVGIVPFIIYLVKTNALYDFFLFSTRLPTLVQYGKTPFTPYSRSPENIFTFGVLLIAVLYLSFLFLIKKYKFTPSNYLQINLVLILLLYINISIIRSADWIITFVAFLLLLLLLYDFVLYLIKIKIPKVYIFIYFLILMGSVFFGIGLRKLTQSDRFMTTSNTRACIAENLNRFLVSNSEYIKVEQYLKNNLGSGKIFSFPADPVFYVLFNQIPPYYSNNYDSSPQYAQKKQIAYMVDDSVNYVIYNKSIISAQDEVPNYIRANDELGFILSNFTPVTTIGRFVVMKKNSKGLFDTEGYHDFKDLFLDINLENIPKEEGLYKYKTLLNESVKILGVFKSSESLSNYLGKNEIYPTNTLLVLVPENSESHDTSITLYAEKELKSNVSFNPCNKSEPCILNMSRIPIFFTNRKIEKIDLGKFRGNALLIKGDDLMVW